jgi:hypothetical protein
MKVETKTNVKRITLSRELHMVFTVRVVSKNRRTA